MRLKTFLVLVLVAAALVIALAVRGSVGHRALARWLPAIHGDSR
jgi:hypothetical protein